MINNDLNTTSGTKANPYLSNDPKNWDESEKTLKRSTKTYGVVTELSKDLEFTGDGALMLRLAKEYRDIEADVVLEEWRRHPHIDKYYLHSSGHFDFSQYSSDKNYVKVAFKTGGLNPILAAQLNQKFELERLESITGVALDPLDTITAELTSRKILLISSFGTPEGYKDENLSYTAPYRTPFLNIVSNSDEENIQPVIEDFVVWTTGGDNAFDTISLEPYNYFYGENTVAKTIRVNGSFTFTVDSGTNIIVAAVLMVTNASHNEVSRVSVHNESEWRPNAETTITFDENIDLEVDENVAFVLLVTTNKTTAGFNVIRYSDDSVLNVTEDSIRDDSNTKAIFMHEAGDRLMQIITGEQNRFYSSFYGREDIGYGVSAEEYAKTAIALGFWIRKFDDEKLEISMKQFLESSNAIHNTGYTISDVDGVEKVVVEDMKYFFNDFVGITLTEQVSDVERKIASEMYHSKMSFGYKKPNGDNLYEEAMGLEEYNTETTYANPITRVENEYKKVSDFRADSYGREFARRKPKLNYPKQDTRYDKDAFFLDLKNGLNENVYAERIWSDDYELIPTGVYSPETATSLRLTPFRNSERHQWFYGSGLFKFAQDFVRYASSLGNSDLSTKKTGEVARGENADVQINELERPRFSNEWITFTMPVDFYINEQVYGYTIVNGRKIPNFFGKVEFINEFNEKEYGYLFELKPNKEGRWKLLKAL